MMMIMMHTACQKIFSTLCVSIMIRNDQVYMADKDFLQICCCKMWKNYIWELTQMQVHQ